MTMLLWTRLHQRTTDVVGRISIALSLSDAVLKDFATVALYSLGHLNRAARFNFSDHFQ